MKIYKLKLQRNTGKGFKIWDVLGTDLQIEAPDEEDPHYFICSPEKHSLNPFKTFKEAFNALKNNTVEWTF